MKRIQQHEIPLPKILGVLAMEFRGTRDDAERTRIAESYSSAVSRLIKSGKWDELPPMEDQLPDDSMPVEFFKYWSLTPPSHRSARRA